MALTQQRALDTMSRPHEMMRVVYAYIEVRPEKRTIQWKHTSFGVLNTSYVSMRSMRSVRGGFIFRKRGPYIQLTRLRLSDLMLHTE
jgi:hypothetical protein